MAIIEYSEPATAAERGGHGYEVSVRWVPSRGEAMSTSIPSVERVCALHGCTNLVEPVMSGEPRRYCTPAHRKVARKLRRDQAVLAHDDSAVDMAMRPPSANPYRAAAGADTRPMVPATSVEAQCRDGGRDDTHSRGSSAPVPPRHAVVRSDARSRGVTLTSPYRRLVPEPPRRWFRRRASQPYAARGVRPVRRDARLADSTLPQWLRPVPPRAAIRQVPPEVDGRLPPHAERERSWSPPARLQGRAARSPAESARTRDSDEPGADVAARARRPLRAASVARTGSVVLSRSVALQASAMSAVRGLAREIGRGFTRPIRRVDPLATQNRPSAAQRRRLAAERRTRKAAARSEAEAVLSGAPLPAPDDHPVTVGAHTAVVSWRRLASISAASSAASATGPMRLREVVSSGWAPQMREAVLAALHSLSNNRLRSLLTTTGIVVGVAAVIVLVALGNGMRANFDRQFSRLANQVIIASAKGSVPDGRMPRHLTDRDVAALGDPQRAPDVSAVSPAIQGNVVVTAGQAKDNASLVGATENYLDMQNRRVQSGRWFSKAQVTGGERGVVVGQQALHLLWGSGTIPDRVVGSSIRLGHSTFKIQGVLAPDGMNDNSVIVPIAAAREYLLGDNGGELSQITVRSTSVATLTAAVAEVTGILDTQHLIHSPTSRDFTVTTFTELLNQSTQFINFLTMFIVAVAAISLFVGGVGVANIMLVSVTERTREIGIRKAVGAKTTAILRQFLSEAVMMTGLGGVAGVVLGILITVGGAAFLPSLVPAIPVPILTLEPILIAFCVSLAIGLCAGGYPANRAARLRPIDALRFE